MKKQTRYRAGTRVELTEPFVNGQRKTFPVGTVGVIRRAPRGTGVYEVEVVDLVHPINPLRENVRAVPR